MARNGKRRGRDRAVGQLPGELARALGISRTYAYSLLREGRIRSIRVGSRWLIPVREVEAFLKSKGAEEGAVAVE